MAIRKTASGNPHILACIDGSNVTESVCDYATWYGSQLNLPISLLHVIDVPKSNRHDLSGAIGMDSRKHLLNELAQLDEQTSRIANQHGEALVKDAKQHIEKNLAVISSNENAQQVPEVHTLLRRGKLLPAIEHFVHDTRVIILGRRGQDHQNDRVNIGSQIESVVRAVDRPIMVCSDAFETPDSYMLAFDGSPTAKKAVQLICENEMAKSLQGHIVMVDHQDSQYENALYKAQQQMQDAGLNVSAHIIESKAAGHKDVVAALTAFRRQHDISFFVIGAYGHSKWRQFFVGSTTTKLLANTTAPVILLR
ncbi:universal stress protein [Psychrobacter sp. FDAARGOS_221]|uniref:universal stress protein n=1 Tax=Psychrobacter sp. FDAARGOS_221 TaxID=1975705 RepID=UPI000BB583EC|nr:universal stress protein [Psychrobacter sp. FDAARGOS_221]PNK59587.1 universal stress protein [Psychrobacter sp. FDAARGOS_221]